VDPEVVSDPVAADFSERPSFSDPLPELELLARESFR